MPDIYTICMEDDIQRRENQLLLEQINEAYAGPPDPEEGIRLAYIRRLHLRLLKQHGIEWNTDMDVNVQAHDHSDPDSH